MGEKKLRVIDVARASGVPRHMISKLYYETAKRIDIETLDKLCRFLNCRIDELLEYIPDKPEKR